MEEVREGGSSVLPWHGSEPAGRGGDDGGDGEGEEGQAGKGDEHHERGLSGGTEERRQTLLCLSVTKLLFLPSA